MRRSVCRSCTYITAIDRLVVSQSFHSTTKEQEVGYPPKPQPRFIARKLLSGSASKIASVGVSGVVSFFLVPLFVHHLGDREYGFWSIAWTIIGYYNLLDFGLSSAVSQYICVAIGRDERAQCRTIFNTALLLNIVLGAVALVATLAIALATPWFCHSPADVPEFRRVITILGVSTALEFPLRVYAGVLEATLRFDLQNWSGILRILVRALLSVLAILLSGSLVSLAWATLISALPMGALQIWFAQREAKWARIVWQPAEWKTIKSFFSYSIYVFFSYIADLLRFQVDTLVISGLIGLAAVTHYAIAAVMVRNYLVLSGTVAVLRPVFSRLHGAADVPALHRVFFLGTKISICAATFGCFALIAWGRPFIARWMGLRYADAYLPLVALSIAVLLDVGQRLSIDLMYATFHHKCYTYLNWTEGGLNLIFSLLLARPLGIFGVALGTLIGALFVRVIMQPWWVCKLSNIPYGDYVRFLGGNLLRCLLLLAVAIGMSSWGLQPSYSRLIASAVCATVLYLGGAWLVVFSRSERARVMEWITKSQKRYGTQATAQLAES